MPDAPTCCRVSVLAWQGLEGVLYDAAAVPPAPVPSLDLRHMGPMKLSRFWSAVHDALLYADPRAATGGRVSLSGPQCRMLRQLLVLRLGTGWCAEDNPAGPRRASD